MVSSLVIVLREGFEAALIVGMVLAYLAKTRPDADARPLRRQVWLGVAAALALSVAVGGMLFATVGELEGSAEALFEGIAMLLAASVLTWMVFWMRRQAATLGGELRARVDHALTSGAAFGLAAVAFVAVAREGIESALFLFASTENDGALGTLVGGALGLVGAVVLGVLFYRGTVRLNLRRFFQVTSVLVILFAAYLLATGLHELGEAGGGEFLKVAGLALGAIYAAGLITLYLRTTPAPGRGPDPVEQPASSS